MKMGTIPGSPVNKAQIMILHFFTYLLVNILLGYHSVTIKFSKSKYCWLSPLIISQPVAPREPGFGHNLKI